MNNSILSKCIAELGKESPDLSYIRGMLETLLELSGANQTRDLPVQTSGFIHSPVTGPSPFSMSQPKIVTTDTPEGMAVEAALASLGGVRPNLDSLTLEKNVILN